MRKLFASILKDYRLLVKDRVGLLLMFLMPIVLVLLITTLQNNTFKIVNDHQLPLILINLDTGKTAGQFIKAVDEVGMFDLTVKIDGDTSQIFELMEASDALVALTIPFDFSIKIKAKAEVVANQALSELGFTDENSLTAEEQVSPLKMYYSPVLRESYRYAMESALQSALQLVETKQMLNVVYKSLNNTEMPEGFDKLMVENRVSINSIPVSNSGSGMIPNASQHNVPAWTIFAMFFMVTSLGSSLVKEKLSGSFIRLKTMPSGYLRGILSKQFVYLVVALLQVAVIFSIGIWAFPSLGLPALNIPSHLFALLVVSVISGLCAVSYALCIGVFAKTQEQANGFGAVSVVILAAIGGILVPAFAMPEGFRVFTAISPLHWCLESYYGLFLADGNLSDISGSLIPLLLIIIILQSLAFIGLKRKNLI